MKTMIKFHLFILCTILLIPLSLQQSKQSCPSPIYCQGDLLHVIQMAKIFNDSKTFVDLSLVHSLDETLKNFQDFMKETSENATRQQVAEFVAKNFKSVGELDEHWPTDYKKDPKLLKDIPDPVVRNFAEGLVNIWPTLSRRVSAHVFEHPESHSIIPVTNHFIIPGGRFKEYYYWDTYWIIKGLLLSEMYDTAKGIIMNLLSIVDRYGFIPNGGRIYYLTRSQPPLLTLMVSDYVKFSKDYGFLKNNIRLLEKEMLWWMENRRVDIEKQGVTYMAFHYDSGSDTPRPESYREDVETCASFAARHSDTNLADCYTELKSGAESGWDYTVRWFFDKHGEPVHDISTIQCRRNIPVDLNSFLYKCFTLMKKFYMIMADEEGAQHWDDQANDLKNTIEKLMWHKEDGTWYDYDRELDRPRRIFAASNLTPLWAGAMDDSVMAERGGRSVDYIIRNRILEFKGGVPATMVDTGQQWDYPNAWAPYQSIIIIGLSKSGNETAQELATELAHKWVNTNIKAFHENKVMFEKYHALDSGQFGGGGEYRVQAGFGWTNGAVLELIHLFFRTKRRKFQQFS